MRDESAKTPEFVDVLIARLCAWVEKQEAEQARAARVAEPPPDVPWFEVP